MGQKLFEYAIIYHPKPTPEEHQRGVVPKSELLVKPTHVLASTDKEASVLAARALPETHVDKVDLCEIAVRPF